MLKTSLIILCGGVAFASHSSKAATRLLVNHSPEPFSNISMSLAEDALVPFGVWLSLRHPQVVLVLVLIFLLAFIWLAPKVFRAVRLQFTALLVWLGGAPAANQSDPTTGPSASLRPDLHSAVRVVSTNATPIPATHARPVQRALGLETPCSGIRAAATGNIRGLGNSIGYLVIGEDHLAFVAKRSFRRRVYRLRFDEIETAEWRRGLLMNRLVLRTAEGERSFYVFKDVEIPGVQATSQEAYVANV